MARLGSAMLFAAGSASLAGLLLAACQHYGQPKTVADASGGEPIPQKVDYSWDVRPILSQNCFQCHGNDAKNRKAGLRLDVADGQGGAYGKLPEDPGKRAVVPGNPKRSELFRRITSTDRDYRMPPREAHKTVSARDIAVIERWIKQGAKYKPHWAYIPVKEVQPQKTQWDKQAVNPIDRYIYATLAKKGLAPSKEADRETLINRVSLDLTGLPPTLAEVDAFVADKDPSAYEHLVDRLLNSTAYAERQANIWLDVARYADTGGGLNDNEQSMAHPYRDWVISAFKRNIPYDKFVTWQLAGDQLPNPTTEQILATAFIRAGKKNNEGGAIDEDFRLEYVQERTELMGKAFLGLTVGCAKCHDHKYDIISQADYYALGGFFNQIDERGIHGGSRGTPMGPTLEWPTSIQAKSLATARKATEAKWSAYRQALAAAKQHAAAEVDRMAAAQRASFIKTAIDADTQAYYPFDSGYKGPTDSLMENEQPRAPAQPADGKADTPPGKTRAQVQAEVKVKILAARAQYDALKAAGKPIPDEIMKVINPRPAGRRAAPPAAGKPGAQPVKASLKREQVVGRGADGKIPLSNGGLPTQQPPGKAGLTPVSVVAPRVDPEMPRLASREVDKALDQLVAEGYRDARTGVNSRINKRQLRPGLRANAFLWSPSGVPGGKPAGLSNIKFIPGAKGQGVQMHDSVVFADPEVGKFERFQPYSLDLWIKLRPKTYEDITRPQGPDASILFTSGGVEGQGYDLQLNDGRLEYTITHSAPYDMIKVEATKELPRNSWQHVTVTYDGNSKAAGLKLYVNGQPIETRVLEDRLTRTAQPRGQSSLNFGYFGLQAGANFNRPELVDGAIDELRVLTRALAPAEVAYLHNPQAVDNISPQVVRGQLIDIAAAKDPAVVEAWKALTEARGAEQRVETPIYRLMVAADVPTARVTHILDRGVYNAYKGEVPSQALPRVFKWDAKLPRNRLGLTQWLFDPKNPLTARVYVNRMWQSHFGSGIVQTVEDFGTQGANPTHPELLDYLAIEFQRSGWDQRHMQKLMVMSATYRQASTISKDALEKDPKNFLLARGPRYRLSAEQLRDSALFASGLLVDKVGGDSVFPYQPEGIWDGAAQGFVVYPFDVPADQMHRRSMYTFVKRNAPTPNMVVFDEPDRNLSAVSRTVSNTPLQALVLLNDPQFIEAYRKLAEQVIKLTPDPDRQLVDIFRLAARRHPSDKEMAALRRFRDSEMAEAAKSPADVDKLLAIGVAKSDPSIDKVRLAALTMLTAGVMNSPDSYTLR